MQHNNRHKQVQRIKKKLAAIMAGAAILSAVGTSVMPSSVALAATPPDTANNPPVENALQVKSNTPNNSQQTLNIVATAYAPGAHDNGQWGNKTHLGTQVRPGIIAVDPSIIPLGSRVYIQYPDGHGEYATAEDTGGAIKGNRIDIAKSNVKEAQNFGVKQVKVFVVHSPQKA